MNIFHIFGLYSFIIIIQLSGFSKTRKKDIIFYHSFLFTFVKSDTMGSVLHQIIIKLIVIILSVKDQTTADFVNCYFERIAKYFVVSDI